MSNTAFSDAEHLPFYWRRGTDAALLIHGFPGTPSEMRPLAMLLGSAGWTTQAPLLPGFGPEVDSLPQRNFHEWIDTVLDCHIRLARDHNRIIIVGNSMGGALALTAAGKCRLDGLILFAPFTRFASRLHDYFWPLLSRVLHDIQPFQKADFSSPEIRRVIGRMFKDANPDDAKVQQIIRNLRLPIRALDQLRRVGRAALAAAPSLRAPALILQGSYDKIVTPAATLALLRRLRDQTFYFEMAAGHDLVEPDCPAWPEVAACVLDFAGAIGKKRTGLLSAGGHRPSSSSGTT